VRKLGFKLAAFSLTSGKERLSPKEMELLTHLEQGGSLTDLEVVELFGGRVLVKNAADFAMLQTLVQKQRDGAMTGGVSRRNLITAVASLPIATAFVSHGAKGHEQKEPINIEPNQGYFEGKPRDYLEGLIQLNPNFQEIQVLQLGSAIIKPGDRITFLNNLIRDGRFFVGQVERMWLLDNYRAGLLVKVEDKWYLVFVHISALVANLGRGSRLANVDSAMKGGIYMNSTNLAMTIKRDDNVVPLPLAQQDLAQLSNIEGLDPVILSIKPASQTALFSELAAHP
jgi:hypothetical protein